MKVPHDFHHHIENSVQNQNVSFLFTMAKIICKVFYMSNLGIEGVDNI